MNLGESYQPQVIPSTLSGTSRNLTLTEQLEGRKIDLESRLKEINDALESLKKNPELENILNLIARVRY